MKKVVLIMLLLSSFMVRAQTVPDQKNKERLDLAKAKALTDEKSKIYNPTAGFKLFMEYAMQDNAYAMNAVAILYSTGNGVALDDAEAIQWFKKAANSGYTKAWYNLGMIYKDGAGAPQDFVKAYQYFKTGADLKVSSCNYALGYLNYKGFGCTQNYEEAVKQFRFSASKGNLGAMYMLGLCHRNGYGISINADSARYWLSKSADKGYPQSITELKAPKPENFEPQASKTVSKKVKEVQNINKDELPKAYQKVKAQKPTEDITGEYSGYLIRYDWSGQNVISKTKLTVKLDLNNDLLNGQWQEENGSSTQLQATLTDSALVFNSSAISRLDHYHATTPVELQFKDAKLQLVKVKDSVYLAGNLQLYAPKYREPEKPMYISLVRKESKSNPPKKAALNQQETLSLNSLKIENLSEFLVYPNPFNNSFTISFNMSEQADVIATLADMNGKQVYKQEWKNVSKGPQKRNINIAVIQGNYVLTFVYGNQTKSTILIKQ